MIQRTAAAAMAAVLMMPAVTLQTKAASGTPMYRMYNPNSGEHFYTAKSGERDGLVEVGWMYEGIGWYAPSSSSTPVYRLYNGNDGDHHYTVNAGEKDALIKAGWNDEGIGWYSDDAKTNPVYREYNPHARRCNHNYTANEKEHEALVSKFGWNDEKIGWYASDLGNEAVTMNKSVLDKELDGVLEYFSYYADQNGKENYDCENTSSVNMIEQIARNGSILYSYHYGLKMGDENWYGTDPQKKFTQKNGFMGYIDFSQKDTKWAAKNVFHVSDAEITRMEKEYAASGKMYIQNGRYYVGLEGGIGGPGLLFKYRSVKSDGKKYYVTYEAYVDPDYYCGTYDAVLSQEVLNGRVCWTIWKHTVVKERNS